MAEAFGKVRWGREALEECEERREEESSLMRSLALTLIFGELAGLPE